MGENEQKLSLRDAIAQGFNRTDAPEEPMAADNAAAVAPEDAAQVAEQPGMTAEQGAALPGTEAPMEAPAAQEQQYAPANPFPQAEPAAQQAHGDPGVMQFLMAQLQQAQAQNQQLAAQLQQAQGTMQQQSEAAQSAIDNTMTQPSVTIPVLDFNEMQYDDDVTRAQKIQDWQAAMVQSITDSVAAQYARQLEPIREDYENKRRIADNNAAKSSLYGDPRFADLKDRDAQIENIISSTPEFDGMSADKKYLYAGLMARGLNYQPQPSAEELVKMVEANPDAQRMLDANRARQIAGRNNQIPTIMPSSGMSTANAVPDQSPQTKDDLHRRIAEAFRR